MRPLADATAPQRHRLKLENVSLTYGEEGMSKSSKKPFLGGKYSEQDAADLLDAVAKFVRKQQHHLNWTIIAKEVDMPPKGGRVY